LIKKQIFLLTIIASINSILAHQSPSPTIAVSGSDIYLSGKSFIIPGETTVRGVIKWDGRSWSTLGQGMALMPVLTIRVSGDGVYVGG
jgi:hypothetical protein